MSNIRLNFNKKEFEKNKQKYLAAYMEHDYAKETDAESEYELDEEIDCNSLEFEDNEISFDGQLGETNHWAHITLSLTDEDYLELLKICLKKINHWKEAMKALDTVKNVKIKPNKKK